MRRNIKTLYHVSPIKNRISIVKHGLLLFSNDRSQRFGQKEKRIYLVDKLWKLNSLLALSMWNTHPDFKNGFDVYEIEIDSEIKLYKDEKFTYGLYVKQEIKPEFIKTITTIENKWRNNLK